MSIVEPQRPDIDDIGRDGAIRGAACGTAPPAPPGAGAHERPRPWLPDVPRREDWRRDVGPYLRVDPARGLGQIASATLPYMGVWLLAWVLRPGAWLAIGLGIVATAFLVRMYSLFHDLTHGSLLGSRAANRRWGRVLGFLLFTPYRWWQHQHGLHHAHAGNLDHRGPGELFTMTVGEFRAAPRVRRLLYRAYRNPLVILLVGPSLIFLFERRFPRRGMGRRTLTGVAATNLALAAWAVGLGVLLGWQTYVLIQGTTLVAGGAVAAWMLYIQHQYEDTYYARHEGWRFELSALRGSSYLRLPRVLEWVVGNANYHHVHHLSPRIPNHRLRAAHEEQPVFRSTPVVGLRDSLHALRLKLWDEDRRRLVGFPRRGEAAGATPDGPRGAAIRLD